MAKNDEKIKALLTKVEEQQAALGTKPKANWTTTGIFKYDETRHININVVRGYRCTGRGDGLPAQ